MMALTDFLKNRSVSGGNADASNACRANLLTESGQPHHAEVQVAQDKVIVAKTFSISEENQWHRRICAHVIAACSLKVHQSWRIAAKERLQQIVTDNLEVMNGLYGQGSRKLIADTWFVDDNGHIITAMIIKQICCLSILQFIQDGDLVEPILKVDVGRVISMVEAMKLMSATAKKLSGIIPTCKTISFHKDGIQLHGFDEKTNLRIARKYLGKFTNLPDTLMHTKYACSFSNADLRVIHQIGLDLVKLIDKLDGMLSCEDRVPHPLKRSAKMHPDASVINHDEKEEPASEEVHDIDHLNARISEFKDRYDRDRHHERFLNWQERIEERLNNIDYARKKLDA